jgi:hypothetical protein
MEFVLIVGGLLLLVAAYFLIGALTKFLLGWWIMLLGVPILAIVGLVLGWTGAIVALAGFCLLLIANNHWQGCGLYLWLEQKVDKAFYFSDT